MNIAQLAWDTYRRVRHSDEPLRWELGYAWRQAKAAIYQNMHLLVEARVRADTRGEEKHMAMDYLDPPDHVVIACLCGKEFS